MDKAAYCVACLSVMFRQRLGNRVFQLMSL